MRHPVPSPAPTSPLPARRRHASGPHLGSALEAAPFRSQQNILEVEFKVCIYAGHGAGGVRWLPAAEAEAGVSQELRGACVQRRLMAVRRPVLRKPGTYAVFLCPCAPSPRHESTSLAPLGRAPPRPLSPAHSLVSWLSPSPEPSSLCLSSISSFCLNLAVNLDSARQVPKTSL